MRRIAPAVLGFVAVALVFAPASPKTSSEPGPSIEAIDAHPIAFFDRRTFELSAARAAGAAPRRSAPVRAVILPHHWLAADVITTAMRDLAGATDVRRIILIGPNHIGAGGAAFTASDLPWRAPDGLVRADPSAIEALRATGLVRIAPAVLSSEHSVAGLIPALPRFYPDATVAPIVVRSRPAPAEIRGLASALAGLLAEPGTVIIASVDFSHYRTAIEAAGRDRESLAALSGLESGRVLGFGNEHLDSPGAVALLIETMRLVGATRFDLWRNAISSQFGGGSAAPNVTSYIVGAYR